MTTTLLFTDVEGSTRLLHELGDGYAAVLAQHRRVLREAFGAHGGAEVDTQGDAFFFTFADPAQAVVAAMEAQAALADGPVRVRMGLHTGAPTRTEEGWVGVDVHLGARIAAAGHGGQVLLSKSTRDVIDSDARDLGEHRVKDFDEPVWIYQVGDDAFPPLKTISNTNLPRPASSFVGREREVAELVALLRESRLVTLTGPGGSGKTRLSLEAAAEVIGEYRNGVFWVGLATVREAGRVVPAIAQTIGAHDELSIHIGDRELLLLLDNLEQVVDAAPELASLVEACPHLTILVTSRELLRVRGEVEYEVLPLADPDAVALFTARAQLEPSAAIEELCRRLDNMPLALELAAARSKALSPDQILARLAQRLDLFKGGRDAEARQATLRATIEWSHELLSPEEQRLFAHLGVFVGGCTVEAAEGVVEAGLDTLQSLVEKSLLRHTNERFWMLETIREYAVERLGQTGEAGGIRRRHAEYFRTVAESTCLAVERIEQGTMRYDIAIAEQDNMRGAIDWALEHDPQLGLRIAIELEQFWITKDPAEGARRFAALLDRAGEIPPDLRAAALRVFGGTTQMSGDQAGARELYRASLAEYERLGDEWAVIHQRHRIGTCAINLGEWATARSLAEETVALAHAYGSRYLECETLMSLAEVESNDGNTERALELYRRHVDLAREIGFVWFEAIGLVNLAELSLKLGRADEVDEYACASLEICREIEDERVGTYALAVLAAAAGARGDPVRAAVLWGAVEAEQGRSAVGGGLGDHVEGFRAQALTDWDAELESSLEAGRRLSWGEAVDSALVGRNGPVQGSRRVRT